MRTTFSTLALLCIFFITSCNKTDSLKKTTEETENDLSAVPLRNISGHIAAVTNIQQSRYGAVGNIAHIEAKLQNTTATSLSFEAEKNIKANNNYTLFVNGYTVNNPNNGLASTGTFFSSGGTDSTLDSRFASFYGRGLSVNISGHNISATPTVPYTNIVRIDSYLKDWTIKKSKGITLNWDIRNLKSGANNIVSVDTTKTFNQVNGATTALIIVPSDLAHTTGALKYWLLDKGTKSFKITSSALSAFGKNEFIDIFIGSATKNNYSKNDNDIDIVSLNSTKLPKIQLK